MDLGWNALMLACLWGAADLLATLAQRTGAWGVVPRAVWRLAALGVIALAGFGVCAVGFTPAPPPTVVEALGPHPLLIRLLLLPGFAGLVLACGRGWRARDVLNARSLAIVAACTLALLAVGLWACLPPDRVDETLYHLALPLQYLRAGGFVVIPGHGNSGFPALGEMLFFWCLGAGALPAARAVQLLVLAMGVDALQSLLPKARAAVLGAAVLFVLTPVVLWELPAAYIDVLQAVFEVVGLVLLARWAERDEAPALLAGGWLTGCAAACKYLALAQVPLFGLLVLLIVRARGPQPPLRPVFMAGALSMLPVLPWLGRNVLVFANPVFPFAGDYFPGETHLLPAQMQVLDLFMAQHGPLNAQGQSLYGFDALLHLPAAFFAQAAFSSAAFDGVMGCMPVLAIAVFLWAHFSAPLPRAVAPPLLGRLLATYMGFRLLVWLSTSWQMRFLIGPQLALCLLCALAVQRLPRAGVWLCATALLLLQVQQSWEQRLHAPRFSADAVVDRGARHRLRLDYDPPSVLCDQAMNLPVKNLMLVWTQRRALWCDVPLWADSYDEGASLAHWLEAGAPVALRALQARHISHLLIDEAAFTQVPAGLDPPEQMRLQKRAEAYAALKAHALALLATEPPVSLLEVAPPPTAED